MSQKSKPKSRSKTVTFSAICVKYAKDHDIADVTVAAKRLRAKVRNAVGKDDVITRYVEGAGKTNRDGNRYPAANAAQAKAILSL